MRPPFPAICLRFFSVLWFAFFLLHGATAYAIPGPLLDPRPDLTPVFKFVENYSETAELDPDDLPFHIATPRGSATITISGSMAGIQPSTFTAATTIEFALGGALFSGVLGDGGWIPGKTSAVFLVEGISDLGDPVTIGKVTCSWDAKSFSIAAVGTTPDAFPVLDPFFPDPDVIETNPADETKFTGYSVGSATFAGVSGERRIYLSGKTTATQKSFGIGADKEIVDLNALTATGSANYTPPAVSIVSPAANLKTNLSTVLVQVLSQDAEELDVKVGGEDFSPASLNETMWETTVELARGSNLITVRATDVEGLQSTATVSVTYKALGALKVTALENGTVSDAFTGTTQQELGSVLSIKAVPNSGFVFAEWTRVNGAVEEVISIKPNLSYLHDTAGVELRARFVQNPFLPAVGKYAAYTTFSTDADPSGIVVIVGKTGAFSGKLLTGGKRFPIKGQLASDGSFTGIAGNQNYQLAIDLPKAQLGRLSATFTDANGIPIATLAGNRAIFSAANPVAAEKTGLYHALLSDSTHGAGRRGYAAWILLKTGAVRLAGVLDDGNKFSAGVNVDGSLQWVFNASLTNKGRLFGSVNSTAEHLFSATARCRAPATKFSSNPANFLLSFYGEKFVQPAPNKRVLSAFDANGGKIVFHASRAAVAAITDQLVISAQNKISIGPGDANHPVKSLKINLRTGAFTGTFLHSESKKALSFTGVFLSDRKEGAGLFFGPGFSGQIQLTPGN